MKKYLLYIILFSIHIAAAADDYDLPEELLSSLRNIYYFDVDSNSTRIQKLIDPDLDLYRNLPWFLELSGGDIRSQEGCIDILERSSTWFGLKPGIYPTSEIDFFKDGKLEMRFFSFSENQDGDYYDEWTTKKGTYAALSGGRIIINLKDGTEYIGEFEKKIFNQPVPYYYLILTDDLGGRRNSYCVYPDPCSA